MSTVDWALVALLAVALAVAALIDRRPPQRTRAAQPSGVTVIGARPRCRLHDGQGGDWVYDQREGRP